jgi:hypothetical protein
MQIMLITLSYAEAANNLQIILTIKLTPLKMDEHSLLVDLRSRHFAFRRRFGKPPRRKRLWGLPCPVLLQESRAFRANQL